MRILSIHRIDHPFIAEPLKPLGLDMTPSHDQAAFQDRESFLGRPTSHSCSRLLAYPWIRGWLRMGDEDNIELIIQRFLMSAPGEGQEKGCFPHLLQSPGKRVLALEPHADNFFLTISAFYSIPLLRFPSACKKHDEGFYNIF